MSDEPTPASDEPTERLASETPGAEPVEVVDPDTLKFNVMSIESVLFDLSDSSPLVHLIEEETPYRYLAIPIALVEAVALHNALDKIDGRRPGTHEVMAEVRLSHERRLDTRDAPGRPRAGPVRGVGAPGLLRVRNQERRGVHFTDVPLVPFTMGWTSGRMQPGNLIVNL